MALQGILPADQSDTSSDGNTNVKTDDDNVERVISDISNSDKIELRQEDAYTETAFAFPTWKKWSIITVIFVIQCSMNLNASLYGNAVTGLTKEFDISEQAARVGQCVFLIAYAFGCELWAPWSEEFGRWPIMQLSLSLVNLWQIPCALAPNYATIVICRFLGGLSSAGGSVTLVSLV